MKMTLTEMSVISILLIFGKPSAFFKLLSSMPLYNSEANITSYAHRALFPSNYVNTITATRCPKFIRKDNKSPHVPLQRILAIYILNIQII